MNVIEEVNEQEVYNYSKIIRPTSMRSTYWKFFGFPADDSGANEFHIRSTDKKNQIHINNDLKQVYSVKQQPNDIIANPDDLIEILAEDVDPDDYQEVNDDYQIEYLTSEDVNNFDEDAPIVKPVISNNAKSLKRKCSETLNIESSLVSMIVDDLLPTTISEGSGFINFVSSICGSRVEVPNSKSIEKQIQRLYHGDYNRLSQNIKTELDEKFFSIGFEKWSNKEELTFITTHVNFLTDDDQLNTVVLNVIDSSYASDWKRHFSMLKMEHCAAAIVDFDVNEEDSLKTFLENYKIPVVPCFLTTIAKAATKCFTNVKVEDIFARAINVFNELSRFVPDVADPPKINKNFWMTIVEFLENNSDRFDADTKLKEDIEDIKRVIGCLTPLKLTLETVSMEQLALASLIRPLTSQLINSHFTYSAVASPLENELNAIIHKELENTQSLASSFLMQASFLDPRFQSLQSADDVAVIKRALKILNDVDPDIADILTVKKEKECALPSTKTKTKSVGLKFFFANKEQKATPNKSIDRFDMEFNNYNANADANLDQLVLSWWKESASLYPHLKRIANRFNCVLLSVQKCEPNLQKQISFYEKRAMCSGNSVDCLLWLHQHRNN